jgi:hypothetical protein
MTFQGESRLRMAAKVRVGWNFIFIYKTFSATLNCLFLGIYDEMGVWEQVFWKLRIIIELWPTL